MRTAVPTISLIVPLDLEALDTVEGLLESVGAATLPLEVIFVGAGTDAPPIARTWVAAGNPGVFVACGDESLAARRAAGLAAASGTWVAFPRDTSTYEAETWPALDEFIAAHGGDVDLIALRVLRRRASGEVVATHRGDGRFASGSRVAELSDEPEVLPAHIGSVLMRRSSLDGAPMVEPIDSMNDTLLAASALRERRRVGLLATGGFVEPAAPGADPQVTWFRRSGDHYLDRLAAHRDGLRTHTSVWRAHALVHDLHQLLRFETSTSYKAVSLSSEQQGRLIALATDALTACPDGAVDRYPFGVGRFAQELVASWGGSALPSGADWGPLDEKRGLVRVRFRFTGAPPAARYLAGSTEHQPVFGKVRLLDYFGQREVRERLVWVHRDVDSIEVSGQVFVPAVPPTPATQSGGIVARARRKFRAARRSWFSRAALVRALTGANVLGRDMRGAWAFMDRADLAGDNAEHMYRWMRENHPEVRSHFILRADSPDFERLRTEGFDLVAYGTLAHQVLLNQCAEYLSSHAGIDVTRPRNDRLVTAKRRHRFTFLQHGVIHNDLSLWLNRQSIDVFVTSTRDEYRAIAGDDSPYVFTDREVVLAGLPRFDRLRDLASQRPWDGRDLIVFAPTWRNSLFLPPERPGASRLPREGFEQTDYVRSIVDVLSDDRLLKTVRDNGWRIVFLPHPNVGAHFPTHLLPSDIELASYAGNDIQDLLTRARVFLTDYSSVAFDAALADAAVVYLQHDRGSMFGVDHTLHPGYFDFDTHGFGPVSEDSDAAVEHVVAAAVSGRQEPYRDRVRSTFAYWDGGSSQRVYEALTQAAPDAR